MSLNALIALDKCYAQNWIVDSRASFHVTPHKEWFSTYSAMHGTMKLSDSHHVDICNIGDIKLCMRNGTKLMLQSVRHASKLTKSLMSIGQLDDLGYSAIFNHGSWMIKKGNLVMVKGQKSGSLYSFKFESVDLEVELWKQRQQVVEAIDKSHWKGATEEDFFGVEVGEWDVCSKNWAKAAGLSGNKPLSTGMSHSKGYRLMA
ncbi:hypothetical protein L7F22_029906 [Adiantum nelumboides]|nr:hypothetical protein [Adiantum nelumboides]